MRARTGLCQTRCWIYCQRNSQKNPSALRGQCCSSAFLTVKTNAFTYTSSTGNGHVLCIHRTDESRSFVLFSLSPRHDRGSRETKTSKSGSGLTGSMSLLNDAYRGNTKRQMNRYSSTSSASHYGCIHDPQLIHKLTLRSKA